MAIRATIYRRLKHLLLRFMNYGDEDVTTVRHLMIRAGLRFETHDYEGALGDYLRVLQREEDSQEAILGVATSLILLKRYEEAQEILDDLLDDDLTWQDALELKATLCSYQGDNELAIRILDQMIDADPQRGMSYYYRGFNKVFVNDIQSAEIDCKKAQQLLGEAASVDELGAEICLANKQYIAAIENANKAIQKVDHSDRAYSTRARAHFQLANFKQARHDCECCLELFPTNHLAGQLLHQLEQMNQ